MTRKKVALGLCLTLGVSVVFSGSTPSLPRKTLEPSRPPVHKVTKKTSESTNLVVRYKSQESDAPDGMRTSVWDMAKAVRKCAVKNGEISESANLAIIDYDMPSSEKRLWIVDPSKSQTLAKDWVAHGSGSGELIASRFSNTEGSFQSSLGVFRVGEVYTGQHGASLRLDGLEAGFNDQARPRSIVMHAAWYVSPTVIEDTGRLGRSQGCPAVRSSVLDIAEKELAEGGLLFSYSSKSKWTEKSHYLGC